MKGHRSKLAKGQHEAVPPAALGALACVATRNDWSNSLLFGLAGALIGAGTVGMLMLLPLPPFSPLAYALFKGVWAGLLAAWSSRRRSSLACARRRRAAGPDLSGQLSG